MIDVGRIVHAREAARRVALKYGKPSQPGEHRLAVSAEDMAELASIVENLASLLEDVAEEAKSGADTRSTTAQDWTCPVPKCKCDLGPTWEDRCPVCQKEGCGWCLPGHIASHPLEDFKR